MENRHGIIWGFLLILMGAFFLAVNMYPAIFGEDFWPFIVIGVGGVFLLAALLTRTGGLASPGTSPCRAPRFSIRRLAKPMGHPDVKGRRVIVVALPAREGRMTACGTTMKLSAGCTVEYFRHVCGAPATGGSTWASLFFPVPFGHGCG